MVPCLVTERKFGPIYRGYNRASLDTGEYSVHNMDAMFTIDPRDPETYRTYLTEPLRAAKDALEDGVSWAETVLHERPYNPWVWANLVRYHAYCRLAQPGIRDWSLTPGIPNSGIEITKGPLTVRVLKSLKEAPPNPGHSASRRAYYQQQCLELDYGGAA